MENGPSNFRAIDCGAGIGRITKHLLIKHFDKVDLVEQNKIFLEKAKEYLSASDKVGHLYCCGLQNFVPEAQSYDVIWYVYVLIGTYFLKNESFMG